jgi:transcriptional regulator with XRE-family HTH domain
MMIIPDQIRAARALLRLEQGVLAQDAGISVVTLRRLEEASGLAKVAPGTVARVRAVLERAGVEFIDRGVRRRAPGDAELAVVRREIDEIVARAVALQADRPLMQQQDLYDENGV